ncbi:protein kinase domain-containing protein [Sorangium sp. So ce131]|uniref:serine/threonine-protein kinase n=1 Tax=Sorangium sp. So ce131 TaxID=3133282 RepID=UPI003F5F4247
MNPEAPQPRRIGRYLIDGPIASGGMASVHLGRLVGEAGFSRTVAIKRLHPELAAAPEIAESLLDEARIVARIQHPNVVATVDLLLDGEEVFLVMEYVRGESLARLLRAARARGEPAPVPVVASITCGVLHGLHAAHEARSESGEPLGIVHRDVSPENVLVGADGTARLLDFGIAKARGRLSTTRGGQLKGKLPYMSPEQVLCADVTRRTDVFAAGVVLWEALAGQRLFDGADEAAIVAAVLERPIPPPSSVAAHVPPALDAIVLRALERNAEGRYATARDLAIAVEDAVPLASPRALGEWVERLAGEVLARRDARVAAIESASAAGPSGPGGPVRAGAATRDGGRAAAPSEAGALEAAPGARETAPGARETAPGTRETTPARPAGARQLVALATDTPESGMPSGIAVVPAARGGEARTVRAPTRPLLALSLGALLLGSAVALAAHWSRRSPTGPEDAARSAASVAPAPASSTAPAPVASTAPAQPAPSEASSAPAAAPAPAASTATPEPSGPAAPAAERTARATPDAPATRAPAPARRTPAPAKRTSTPATRASGAAANRCTPPYTVDRAGIRRLKPECL